MERALHTMALIRWHRASFGRWPRARRLDMVAGDLRPLVEAGLLRPVTRGGRDCRTQWTGRYQLTKTGRLWVDWLFSPAGPPPQPMWTIDLGSP